MDDIREKVVQLQDSWKKVYAAMPLSPEAWKPHIPYSTSAEIDEVVSTIASLLGRIRAPTGFTPTFRIARGFSLTALNNALTSAKSLEGAQYASFPAFLVALNQILSAFLTMLYFSDSDESRRTIEGLGGRLSEALSLLDTAQKELSQKAKLLTDTQELAESIGEKAAAIQSAEENTKAIVQKITSLKTDAEAETEGIKELTTEIDGLKVLLVAELKRNTDLNSQIDGQIAKLADLQKNSASNNTLIRELLPEAASAGLAAAFARRVTQLEKSKWMWTFVFLGSILGLVGMAVAILFQDKQASEELWKIVLQRLPFTAPLIWLGWFSAVQFGNTVRVQEDYAFKEATARAFVGYKDHMEHLADVNIEDTKSAMKLLATTTIEILSHEPLRIYQKSSEDVSPTNSILDRLKFWGKEEKSGSAK